MTRSRGRRRPGPEFFNREFKHRRALATAAGDRFMSYSEAPRRLRRAPFGVAAGDVTSTSIMEERDRAVPTKLQRELFDCAHTAFDSRQTLKGQIARFPHEHNDDEQLVGVSKRTSKFARGKGADIDL
jgi:hypothetical protein